jgi:hypothetical protein
VFIAKLILPSAGREEKRKHLGHVVSTSSEYPLLFLLPTTA